MGFKVVSFTCADGRSEKFSLDFLVERGAIIADKVNGDDISLVMGGANQLWIPGIPAKYFLRDIVKIEFSEEDELPKLPSFEDDGVDYTNRPNVGAKSEYTGRVGEPMVFEGWADDYDKAIVAIEFSLDGGESWTRFETAGATAGRVTSWNFEWTPSEPGFYAMRVRSVNEDGKASPTPAVCNFEIFDETID